MTDEEGEKIKNDYDKKIIKALLDKIGTKNSIETVFLIPESYSKELQCFYNVADKIAIDGGEIVYGWKLHKTSFIIEAERHAVWKSPNGNIIDVTPEGSDTQIYFIREDNGWVFNGIAPDNVRINITNNPLVDDWILLNETIGRIHQTGTRISRTEIKYTIHAVKTFEFLQWNANEILNQIKQGNNEIFHCYCGSNSSYKNCHARMKNDLDYMVNQVLETTKKLV